MKIFTCTEAEQNFSALLDIAEESGKVFIKKDNGAIFVIMPEKVKDSPFDIEGIHSDITTEEILSFIREGRER